MQSNNIRGKLITIEGIEGVGKSSNVQFVAQCLQSTAKQVVITREPGGTPVAEAIRSILLTEFPESTLPETELLLLYAGRLQHVTHVIQPALAQGSWVVCDRFMDATFAYQGAGRGIDLAKIERLHDWALGDFLPDFTIILDAPIDIAFERIQHNRRLDRFEKEQSSFFERIRAYYLSVAQHHPKRCFVVDASQPLSVVQAHLASLIKEILINETA